MQSLTKSTPRRRNKCLFSVVGMLALSLAIKQTTALAGETTVDEILGSPAAEWKMSSPAKVEERDGIQSLCSGATALNLFGTKQYPTEMEYRLMFRLNPPVGGGSYLQFQVGLKDSSATDFKAPGVQISGAPGGAYTTWWVSGKTEKPQWKSTGNYYLKAVTTPSLAWPENLRRQVEADMTELPDVNHKWLTLRYVVRKNRVLLYVDDRLLDIQTGSALSTSGAIRLVLSPNVEVASLRVTPLQPEDAVYRPINIDGFLNQSQINGQAVDHGTLPKAQTATKIGGVPFVFPQSNSKGNDHIALAPSWAQFGALETYIESYGGEFGGRWPTALTVNPARIQIRLPNDHYNRLYAIAAASDEPNSVPVITAQFYKALSGYPENFSTRVPLFSAKATTLKKLPVKLKNGTAGALYLVAIDLDPGKLSKLGNVPALDAKETELFNGDLPILEMELTKGVASYVCYPDPATYSIHQAGLPSSVHIYALTMQRTPVSLDFRSDKFAGVWTAPAVPSYTVKLGNPTSKPRTVELKLTTTSHDGSEKTVQTKTVTVAAGETAAQEKFSLPGLKKNGYQDVILTMKDGSQTWVEKRSLARLAADNRERGNWEPGRGPMMGYWVWGGGHDTPNQLQELQVMAEAGAETRTASFDESTPAGAMEFAKTHQFVNFFRFNQASIYDVAFFDAKLKAVWDSGDRQAAANALVERLKTREVHGPIPAGNMVPFFPEPSVGMSTFMNHPEYYGEPEYKLTPDEEVIFKGLLEKFLLSAKTVRKQWPDSQILLPHGDPLFCIPFLRNSQEARDLIDGVCIDMPNFDRLPEMQLHQVAHLRLYEMMNEFRKYGKKPEFITNEATFVPTPPNGISWDEQADIHTRNMIIFFMYGVYRQASTAYPFDCANYWGEEHYGVAGLMSRLPHVAPKPSYVAYATMTRHLNRANYEKMVPTGSLTAYALQFKHYKTGKQINVLWTVRGNRTVTLKLPAGADVKVYDEDDNLKPLVKKEGAVIFSIDGSPCYVEGLSTDPVITLGEADNSDSKPAPGAVKLANPGDGTWKVSTERDSIYENNTPMQVVRFPGRMSLATTSAPAKQGGKAGAVHLEKQDKERQLMPWYTTLVPQKPIVIPGQGSHLGLWVHGASDWGRVVYCLRDAKGQRWVSIGTKESWNCDDTRQLTSFCFDGWRYLRFELPANAPYDNFRHQGSEWWGHYGPGEGVVHLPLSLDKIIVERRTHVLYLDSVQPARPDDVLLGDLMVEYATPFDKTEAAVKLSRVQMPASANSAALPNPIADLEAKGVGDATRITRIDPPAHEYDGTRGVVSFDEVTGAKSYDIWVSPYADGRGAVKLAAGWTKSGLLMLGLRPEIEFYAFVVYTDKDGQPSKPSQPFKFTLKDMFPMK